MIDFINIVTVDFNTKDLVHALVKSIKKNIKSFDYDITVFDNSTKYRFEQYDDIHVIYGNDMIDFNQIVKQNTLGCYNTPNDYGTLKHSYTIDWILYNLKFDNILLFDSDTILKRDIDFIDDKYITVAANSHEFPRYPNRLYPFIQYFNVKKIRENNIHYFDGNRTMFGLNIKNAFMYDSGTSFLEDIQKSKLEYKEIDFHNYIEHFGNASWCNKDRNAFLNANTQYYT